VDSDQRNGSSATVLLHDLVTDPDKRAPEIVPIEDQLQYSRPFLASLDRVKGTDEASVPASGDVARECRERGLS
jgi:hypothetical protein